VNLKLTEDVLSPQDLRAAILEIHDYAKWFSHNAIKKRVSAKQSRLEAPPLSPGADSLIKQGLGGKETTGPRLDKIIRGLEDFERSADHITITLAEAPSGGIKKSLAGWCRQNIGGNQLISFEFNSNILGGMVLNRGSRIYDWSFRRRILEERAKFPEVLRRV
jgi:hypothetical protein